MSNDTIFVNGMIVKYPHDKAPDYVLTNISIKVEELIEFLEEHDDNGWVNIEILEGKSGKPYAKLNNYKKADEDEAKPRGRGRGRSRSEGRAEEANVSRKRQPAPPAPAPAQDDDEDDIPF